MSFLLWWMTNEESLLPPLQMPNDWTLLNWINFQATRIQIITSNSLCYSVFPLPWNVLTKPLPINGIFYVYSLQQECVFGELLASNGLLLLLHYSDFQASYNNSFSFQEQYVSLHHDCALLPCHKCKQDMRWP
jgi:hypothetical protein